MTTLQQSSKARDRNLGEWYEQIRTGQLKLPRFQRFEAWDRGRILGFLNTIIQNLPVGVTLLLEVGDKEKFVSRHVATAPEPATRVTEHLLDGQQRLPVLAACLDGVPTEGDALGRGERLLRAYLWSVCFTTRYEGAAATRSFQDYKALATLLKSGSFGPNDYSKVPVLNRMDYPLPNYEQLMRVGWPKGADRIARSTLAATLYFGGWDFADGRPASYESLKAREYHHIFPDALLQEAGIDSSLALNCALITWKTNRSIGRKDPLDYLKDRVEWSSEADVRQRLKTHLLDYNMLAAARYVDAEGKPLTGAELAVVLRPDFQNFLENRARCVAVTAAHLADGNIPPSCESVIAEASQTLLEKDEI